MRFWQNYFKKRVKVDVWTHYSEAAHWMYVENGSQPNQIFLTLPTGKKRICRPISINWIDPSLNDGDIEIAVDSWLESKPTGEADWHQPTASLTVWDEEAGERLVWAVYCTYRQFRQIRRIFNRAARAH
ncbi:MAG: hypothetical protein ABF586_12565 [Sporolactobacillus sp.]